MFKLTLVGSKEGIEIKAVKNMKSEQSMLRGITPGIHERGGGGEGGDTPLGARKSDPIPGRKFYVLLIPPQGKGKRAPICAQSVVVLRLKVVPKT